MAENAQHDLDEALPALQEAVKVLNFNISSSMENIRTFYSGFGGSEQKGSY